MCVCVVWWCVMCGVCVMCGMCVREESVYVFVWVGCVGVWVYGCECVGV